MNKVQPSIISPFCKRTVTPLGFSAHMADTIRRAIATQDDGAWAKEELT